MRLSVRACRLLLAGAVSLLTACSSPGQGPAASDAGGVRAAEDRVRESAAEFLDRYVDPDGRVVRRDQGGDTVSEGQAYGLLLAQVAGDSDAVGRIWEWTAEHIQRPDGLLSFRADAERVLDDEAASDADVLAAWALLRAGDEHRDAGLRLADAVLSHEVVEVPGVGPVLAAGPWAVGSPATLNPSYWAPGVFDDLARRTGEARWGQLADTALVLAESLTDGGRLLPPDWARVDGADVTPSPAPGGAVPDVRYGLDAQRLLVWLAGGCDPAGQDLAAGAWELLEQPERSDALALRPDGTILDDQDGALPLVASAAAAAAAGVTADRDRLLDDAAEVSAAYPSYYQDAWAVLGPVLLTTDLLTPCEPGS